MSIYQNFNLFISLIIQNFVSLQIDSIKRKIDILKIKRNRKNKTIKYIES